MQDLVSSYEKTSANVPSIIDRRVIGLCNANWSGVVTIALFARKSAVADKPRDAFVQMELRG